MYCWLFAIPLQDVYNYDNTRYWIWADMANIQRVMYWDKRNYRNEEVKQVFTFQWVDLCVGSDLYD